MKRPLSFILSCLLLFFLAACGVSRAQETTPPEQQASSEPSSLAATTSVDSESLPSEPKGSSRKALVVYFSCTGNTKAVAETIVELTGADIYEIVPKTPYTDEDLNYRDNDCRANREMNDDSARPAILGDVINLADYDTVYLGFPIWWGTMPKIVNTFLDTCDLSGKTVLPFCTSGGSGISTALSAIKSAEPEATVTRGLHIGSSSTKNCVDAVSEWVEKNVP